MIFLSYQLLEEWFSHNIMFDPDDEFKPEPAPKESKRTTRWSPKLLKLVKDFLRKEITSDKWPGDLWVVQQTVAFNLQAQIHEVGHVFAALCLSGLLDGPRQHPTTWIQDDPKKPHFGRETPEMVAVGNGTVKWNGEYWVNTNKYPYHLGWRRDPRLTRVQNARIRRNPPKDAKSNWDGIAYKVNKESQAFAELMVPIKHSDYCDCGCTQSVICDQCGESQGFRGRHARHERGHDKTECKNTIVKKILAL